MAASAALQEKLVGNSLKLVAGIEKEFHKATRSNQPIDKYLKIGRYIIRLHFANAALVNIITPALAHLEVARPKEHDLTICLWDSASTNTNVVAPPWPHHYYSDRGEIIHGNNERIYSLMDPHTRALSVFDKERNIAFYWTRSISELPWWASGSPLQYILHWWSFDHHMQLTHAACVGKNNKGVLLAGKSGSGKSTTTLACIDAGLQYISEDYCLLEEASQPKAHSVYNSAKLEQKTLNLFPAYQPFIHNKNRLENEKALIFQNDIYPERILASADLTAILIPTIQPIKNSWLEPIPTDETLSALAVSTMWQLVRSTPANFQRLKRIAESLPTYRLHLGRDFKQIPELIGSLL